MSVVVISPVSAHQHHYYVKDFGCGRGLNALNLPTQYSDLRRIGNLLREEKLSRSGLDERRLVFDGLTLEVVIYRGIEQDYMVGLVAITSASWTKGSEFKIGQSIKSVQSKFGKSGKQSGDLVEFGGDTDSVVFRVAAGKIVGITYDCYTG